MKRCFFQAAVESILLYGCTTWTLTKRLEKLDGNYTRMLRAILHKSWRQHPTKHQLYGHLPPITKLSKLDEPDTHIYIYIYIYINRLIGQVGRVSEMVLETGFNPRSCHTKDFKKWYLIPPCLTLSNIRYVSRVKWSNPGKGVAPILIPRCSSY